MADGASADLIERAAAHPANRGLRAHRQPLMRPGISLLARPEEYEDPYYGLGTHPDLVAHLWDELGATLPADCRFVFMGAPALVRPDSGVVFGFAGGTHTYALRLPDGVRAEALAAGAKRVYVYPKSPPLDLEPIGPEWVFLAWQRPEKEWTRAAYELAAPAQG